MSLPEDPSSQKSSSQDSFAPDNWLPPGEHLRELRVLDLQRSYIIHVPKTSDPTAPRPVVLAFHGGGTNAEMLVRFSGLSEKAEAEGFTVVYPNGTGRVPRGRTFNAGICCGYAKRHEVDEVAFVTRLLEDLPTVAAVDPQRIYATGMSNGAMMCYLIASEMADRIAAIAPVGGPMGYEECHPSRPVPVCHFHGTADLFAPYEGGIGNRSLSKTDFYSVAHTISKWVAANGCNPEPVTQHLPTPHDDGTSIVQQRYLPLATSLQEDEPDGAEVVLYTINGGGHTWPGRQSTLHMLGGTTLNLNANDTLWEFFQRYRLPDARQ